MDFREAGMRQIGWVKKKKSRKEIGYETITASKVDFDNLEKFGRRKDKIAQILRRLVLCSIKCSDGSSPQITNAIKMITY